MFCSVCGGETTDVIRDGALRPVCRDCGQAVFLDPKLAVTVVLEQNDTILLGLRGAHTREPGKWSFPGGFVDRGEVVESAAVREVFEETGLQATLSPILDLLSHDGDSTVLAVYAATSFEGTPAAGDDLDDLGWFHPDSMPDLAFEHDLHIIQIWQAWRTSRAIS
ncbi:MAG: NUDIX hydrolase [Thermomicrobiales bacterium]